MKGLWSTCCLSLFASSVLAQPVLTDIADQAGIAHRAIMGNYNMPGQGGAAWFDSDNDGFYDLYLTGGSGPDVFYYNNGDGTFTNRTSEAGFSVLSNVNTCGVTSGDINNDGWSDLLVTTFRTSANFLFINNGNGTFSNQTVWVGADHVANSFSASFGDLNMDGWLDLFVCNWSRFMQVTINGPNVSVDSEANFYYENNGNGTFTERAQIRGLDDPLGCALGVMVTDFDNDHDPDLFVANDFGFFNGNSPNRMFRNEYPTQTFVDVSGEVGLDIGMNGMGVTRSDLNGDGKFDFYITNIRNDKLMISSLAGYEDEMVERGLHNDSVWLQNLSQRHWKVGWGAAFLDIDNDMDEDLMVANGSLVYSYPHPALDSNKLFLNNGSGSFTDISFETGVADTYVSRALAYCDFDRDGDLDVFIGITDSIGGSRKSFLYRNDSPAQHWLQVKAEGVMNNRSGIGARINVFVDGTRMIREIGGESSYNSQNWQVAHFGLGSHQTVDSMHVVWYGGWTDRYYDILANQFMEVMEGQSILTGSSVTNDQNLRVHPNPFTNELHVEGTLIQSIRIFDAEGRTVYSGKALQNIRTASFKQGTYLVEIELLDGSRVIKKLVKD